MNQPGNERYERGEQNQTTDNDCPAPGKAAFSPKPATAQKAQYADTDAMRQIVEYEVFDEVQLVSGFAIYKWVNGVKLSIEMVDGTLRFWPLAAAENKSETYAPTRTASYHPSPNSHWQGDFNRSHQCQIMVAAERAP